MARPTKERRVKYIPEYNYFKLLAYWERTGEICLSIEEIEAMRLKDMETLTQEESREDGSILSHLSAYPDRGQIKAVRALIDGKAIRFQGGNYRLSVVFIAVDAAGLQGSAAIE